jgi:hypothetical protein
MQKINADLLIAVRPPRTASGRGVPTDIRPILPPHTVPDGHRYGSSHLLQPYCLVEAAGGQSAPVRGERHRQHPFGVANPGEGRLVGGRGTPILGGWLADGPIPTTAPSRRRWQVRAGASVHHTPPTDLRTTPRLRRHGQATNIQPRSPGYLDERLKVVEADSAGLDPTEAAPPLSCALHPGTTRRGGAPRGRNPPPR